MLARRQIRKVFLSTRFYNHGLLKLSKEGNTNSWELWKYFLPWLGTLRSGRNPLSCGMPWVTFPAIAYLANIVRPNMRVFEFGSGGSTLYFSERVREVVSVEHDPEWFYTVSQALSKTGRNNWRGILLPPEPELDAEFRDPSDPHGYVSAAPIYAGKAFRRYAAAIDQYPDGYFDLVLVDGRARPSCLIHAFNKKCKIIVVDNTERPYYLRHFVSQKGVQLRHFAGPCPFVSYFGITTFIETSGVTDFIDLNATLVNERFAF